MQPVGIRRLRPRPGKANLNTVGASRTSSIARGSHPQRARRTWRTATIALVLVASSALLMACVNDLTPRGRWSQPVAHENFIYVGNTDGAVVRLDAESHQWDANWIYPFEFNDGIKRAVGGRAMYGAATVSDGILYANNYHCTGNVCDANSFGVFVESGDLAWLTGDYAVKTKLVGTPVVTSDGFLVFGTTAIDRERDPPGYLYALEAASDAPGRFAFRVPLDGEVQGDAAYDPETNKVYVGTDAGTLHAIDMSRSDRYANAHDLRVEWQYEADGAIAGPINFVNGSVYFGDLTGKAYKVDTNTQTADWTYTAPAWIWAHPVLDSESGRTYVATLGGHITALDDSTGNVIWEQQIEGQVVGSPLLYTRTFAGVDQQVIAVPSGDQDVYVLNTVDGGNLGAIATGTGVKASPTFFDDKLYIHNMDDQLRWYNASNQSMLGCVQLNDGGRCG